MVIFRKQLKFVFLLLFCFCSVSIIQAQVIFSESFNEANGAISGSDDGISWTATCPGSLNGNDYFKVNGGVLEGRDTNGPSVWSTNSSINTSSCSGITISVTVSESGTMENCSNSCGGCDCIDWVNLEYAFDGGAYTSLSSPMGGNCSKACATGTFIVIGGVSGFYTFSQCLPNAGDALSLRISVQTWADDEKMRIDDITVQCSVCTVPVDWLNFTGYTQDRTNTLEWSTASEENSNYFIIERSSDGSLFAVLDTIKAAGFSADISNYSYVDKTFPAGIAYYRIRQVDFDGTADYSEIISINSQENNLVNIFALNNDLVIDSHCSEALEVTLFNTEGKEVFYKKINAAHSEIHTGLSAGLYIAKIRCRDFVYTDKVILF